MKNKFNDYENMMTIRLLLFSQSNVQKIFYPNEFKYVSQNVFNENIIAFRNIIVFMLLTIYQILFLLPSSTVCRTLPTFI